MLFKSANCLCVLQMLHMLQMLLLHGEMVSGVQQVVRIVNMLVMPPPLLLLLLLRVLCSAACSMSRARRRDPRISGSACACS